MAIITISRQVAALGDEIATAAAERLGYTFIDRKQIEKRIVELGFPKEKLPRYDERKPGFFASLNKDRDEYLNYLQLAVYEAASTGNCILIGRGSFIILEELENLISLRFVSRDSVRMERLKNEFSWDDRQAKQRIEESDENRRGFHRSFFDLSSEDPQHYHLTLNTSLLSLEESVGLIENLVKSHVTPELEEQGKRQIQELLSAQKLVNHLLFNEKVSISFLRATISGKVLVLQGVAESHAAVEQVLSLAKKAAGEYEVKSAISVVQDYKSHI